MIPPSPIVMENRAAWRAWLSKNHALYKEVWLVLSKKHARHSSVTYTEAVEEAICFGWVDGQAKTIDGEKFMQRYSPRKPKSPWSETNIERAKRMIGKGLMTEAGLKIFKKGVRNNLTTPSSKNFSVPQDLEEALRKNETVWSNFQRMPPSARLMFVYWVNSAKTPATRQRRTDKSIELIAENRRLDETVGR